MSSLSLDFQKADPAIFFEEIQTPRILLAFTHHCNHTKKSIATAPVQLAGSLANAEIKGQTTYFFAPSEKTACPFAHSPTASYTR